MERAQAPLAYSFRPSSRGGNILIDSNGYNYYKKKESNVKTLWVCLNVKKSNCPAVVNIVKEDNSLYMDPIDSLHNHDVKKVATKKIVNEFKLKAAHNPDLRPRAVMTDITAAIVHDTASNLVYLPKKESIMRSIRYTKQKVQGRPASPKVLADLFNNMPEAFQVTSNGDKFLQSMEYTDDHSTQAMLVFMSETGRNMLATNNFWSGNGTFATTPKLFKQLYFVGINTESGRFIPAAYCLLTNKTGEAYNKMFSVIVNHVGNVNHVEKFSCDFEKAIHNVVEEKLPNALVSGCLFHYKQAIFNNMKKRNCLPVYNNVAAFRTLLSNIYALAYAPPTEVKLFYSIILYYNNF